MAYLTILNNPFNPHEKTVKQIGHGVAIFYYLNNSDEDLELIVSLNGQITEDYKYVLKENDHLAFVAIPKGGGGGGSNPLRIVAMIALVAIAQPLAAQILSGMVNAGMITGAGVLGGTMGGVILGITQGAVILAGGMLINALMPLPSPSAATSSSLKSVSPTYSFSGGSNAREVGTTLPIMLGSARVTPPIIGSYLSLDGDKQYLNILMAVNDGEVDSISDIEINNQSIGNYNDIECYTTKGIENQAVIGNFRDSVSTVSLTRNLNEKDEETTYTTLGNTVQELEVVMSLPSGLYYITDSGSYQAKSVEFEIAYRKVGDSEWDYLTRNVVEYDYIYSIGSGKYETTKTYSSYQGQYIGSGIVKYGFKEKKIRSSYVVNTQLVSDTYKTTKKLSYKIKELPKAQYEIKVKRVSAYDTNTRVANALALDYINEIVYDDFTYPGVALLSVNALATDQLNGSFPTITCKVSNVGSTKPKSNPAWACYDLLKRDGIEDKNIDLDKFQEWADWCDTKSYSVGLYLDNQQELQSALNIVSLLGRATVVQFGNKFTPIVNKAIDIPTQSFLFTSGNIIESSFSMDYIPYNERTNVIEVTYYDAEDNYNAKTVQLQSHDFDASTIEIKSSVTLYGCTNRQQAANYAQFLLNNNRYITETVSFEADIDAIACGVGDVIKVGKKYMTNTLADGRVVSATATSITLDQEVVLEAGINYEIQFRTQDDEIHVVDVPSVDVDTTTDTITVNTISVIPQLHDVYAFGRQDTEAINLYRVVNITRASNFKRKIKAIEYNADVYNDEAIINVEEVTFVDGVRNLQATETLVKRIDGTIEEILTLSWVGKEKFYENVYVNQVCCGQTDGNSFEFRNTLIAGKTYTFKVASQEITYKFLGKTEKPASVQNIRANWSNGAIVITWDKNKEIDFDYYEINISGQVYTSTVNSLTVNNLDIGDYELKAYAIDTTKNKSDVTNYNLHVAKPCMIYMIRDAYLIEKAFIDGAMTIYTSFTAPTSASKYDIWKVSVDNITLDEFTFDDEILQGISWDTGSGVELYKYFNGTDWILCTTEQIAVVRRMLGQLVSAGKTDNEVKVFNVQPYTPYEVNDLWIDGTTIKICISSLASGSFHAAHWEVHSQEEITIATKLENIKGSA